MPKNAATSLEIYRFQFNFQIDLILKWYNFENFDFNLIFTEPPLPGKHRGRGVGLLVQDVERRPDACFGGFSGKFSTLPPNPRQRARRDAVAPGHPLRSLPQAERAARRLPSTRYVHAEWWTEWYLWWGEGGWMLVPGERGRYQPKAFFGAIFSY